MAQTDLYGPDVAAFEYKEDQPTYWTEYLSWVILKNLANMQQAKFVLADTGFNFDVLNAVSEAVDDYIEDKQSKSSGSSARSVKRSSPQSKPKQPGARGLTDALLPFIPGVGQYALAKRVMDLVLKEPVSIIALSQVAQGALAVIDIFKDAADVFTDDPTERIANALETAFIDSGLLSDKSYFKKAFLDDDGKSYFKTSIGDILAKALLFKDEKNEDASLLRRALIEEDGTEEDKLKARSILQERLRDLLYNDEEIDFGPFRVYLRSKVVDS